MSTIKRKLQSRADATENGPGGRDFVDANSADVDGNRVSLADADDADAADADADAVAAVFWRRGEVGDGRLRRERVCVCERE